MFQEVKDFVSTLTPVDELKKRILNALTIASESCLFYRSILHELRNLISLTIADIKFEKNVITICDDFCTIMLYNAFRGYTEVIVNFPHDNSSTIFTMKWESDNE